MLNSILSMNRYVTLVCMLWGCFMLSAQYEQVKLTAIVTDDAEIFKPAEFDSLTEKLTDFETETTHQLVVLTVKNLGGKTIETYANGVFNRNELGQRAEDNGILIVFSRLDRQVRIEVGYGLEAYITDAVASRIIRNTMVPNFKKGNYFEGIDDATGQIITFLNQPEALAEFKTAIEKDENKNRGVGALFLLVFILAFFTSGAFFFYKSYKSLLMVFEYVLKGEMSVVLGVFGLFPPLLGSIMGLGFALAPGLAICYGLFDWNWPIADYMLNDFSWFVWALVAFTVFSFLAVLSYLKYIKREPLKISYWKSSPSFMKKTFASSGSFSSSSGSSYGSSSSSSGFSGGGGSSGGGGASGSW